MYCFGLCVDSSLRWHMTMTLLVYPSVESSLRCLDKKYMWLSFFIWSNTVSGYYESKVSSVTLTAGGRGRKKQCIKRQISHPTRQQHYFWFDMNVLWSIQRMLAQPGQLWPSEDLFLNKVLLTFSPTIHLQSTPMLVKAIGHKSPPCLPGGSLQNFIPIVWDSSYSRVSFGPPSCWFPVRGKCHLDMFLQAFQG